MAAEKAILYRSKKAQSIVVDAPAVISSVGSCPPYRDNDRNYRPEP